jgi:hypothetical protein
MPYVSLESFNFKGRFIRHQNYLGELHEISGESSELDREDATFWVPDHHIRASRPSVLRSVNFPFHVLRHQSYRLKLHEYNPPLIPPEGLHETPEQKLLREDSLYIPVPGLAGEGVSFRSFNYPDRFIRHRDFHLWVEIANDQLSHEDATFFVRDAFAPPPPVLIH